jgi:hypothetical protein
MRPQLIFSLFLLGGAVYPAATIATDLPTESVSWNYAKLKSLFVSGDFFVELAKSGVVPTQVERSAPSILTWAERVGRYGAPISPAQLNNYLLGLNYTVLESDAILNTLATIGFSTAPRYTATDVSAVRTLSELVFTAGQHRNESCPSNCSCGSAGGSSGGGWAVSCEVNGVRCTIIGHAHTGGATGGTTGFHCEN